MESFQKRELIRATWSKEVVTPHQIVFITTEYNDNMVKEHEQHHDILSVELIDESEYLQHKLMMLSLLFSHHCCSDMQYTALLSDQVLQC